MKLKQLEWEVGVVQLYLRLPVTTLKIIHGKMGFGTPALGLRAFGRMVYGKKGIGMVVNGSMDNGIGDTYGYLLIGDICHSKSLLNVVINLKEL